MKPNPSICLILVIVIVVIPALSEGGNWLKDTNRQCLFRQPLPLKDKKQTISWVGRCVDRFAHGPGVLKWYSGSALHCWAKVNVVKGVLDGPVELHWKNGKKFIGSFINGRIEGQGELTVPNSFNYKGSFRNFTKFGQGIIEFPNGDYYKGAFIDDHPTGFGLFFHDDKKHLARYWDKITNSFKIIQPLVPYTLQVKDIVYKNHQDLIKMIILSATMDDADRQKWISNLAEMSDENISLLSKMLTVEHLKLKFHDIKYINNLSHKYGHSKEDISELVLTEERRQELLAGLGKIEIIPNEKPVEVAEKPKEPAGSHEEGEERRYSREDSFLSTIVTVAVVGLFAYGVYRLFTGDNSSSRSVLRNKSEAEILSDEASLHMDREEFSQAFDKYCRAYKRTYDQELKAFCKKGMLQAIESWEAWGFVAHFTCD